MPSKWAVLVVHGVGDTGPGITVDTFTASLAVKRPRLHLDGRVEVHWLPDSLPEQPQTAPDVPIFPAHFRRFNPQQRIERIKQSDVWVEPPP